MASWNPVEKSAKREVSDFTMTLSSNRGDVKNRVAMFLNKADSYEKKQKENPFSGSYSQQHPIHHKSDDHYGKPVEGSKTEMRGKQAGNRVSTEIIQASTFLTGLTSFDSFLYF